MIKDHWAQLKAESEELPSNIIWFADIKPTKVKWLWPERIPLGRMTLLVGAPGKGKSLVTIDAATRVSCGKPWPDGQPCPMGSAIMISAEDNPNDTIRPRLDAAGANVDKVGLLDMIKIKDEKGRIREIPFSLADIGQLEKELKRLPDCKLVVIDPIGSFMGGNTDAHRDNEVRALLNPALDLAQKLGFAFIVVAHRRKGTAMVADDLALGSRAFTGMARAVWHVTPESNESDRRFMLPGKNNLARVGHGLAFKIHGDPPALVWEDSPIQVTADQGLAIEFNAMKPGPKSQVQSKASAWLKSALGVEPRLANDLYEEARELVGISKATLICEKTDLGIDAFRNEVPGPWYWRWPAAKNPAESAENQLLVCQS